MSPLARITLLVLASGGLASLAPALAHAKVKIAVDLDAQTMHVEAGAKVFDWKVSSGKPGYETPAGKFGVLWMDKDHHSDTYDQAFMPNAIFFAPGYAIHGFGKSPWGHKASHGCVRLPAAKAELLFDLVKAEGADVTITGESPVIAPTVASVEAKTHQRDRVEGQDDGFYPPEQGYAAPDAGTVPVRQSPDQSLFGSIY